MLRLGIFITLVSVFASSYAYEPNDMSSVKVKLNSAWREVGQTDDGKVSLAAYMNSALGANSQTILKTSSRKQANVPADQQVQQLYDDMKKRLSTQGCEIADLQPILTGDHLFKEWDTSFKCRAPLLSGSMIIVDADANNIYTFTFNTNTNVYTAAANEEALKILRENMQLCYIGKTCYVI
jgi:hypothetical protein